MTGTQKFNLHVYCINLGESHFSLPFSLKNGTYRPVGGSYCNRQREWRTASLPRRMEEV
jgi:hypothetical protein